MSLVLRIVVIVLCLLFFAYVSYLVAKKSLLLRYSLIWMLVALLTLIGAIFPQPLFALSGLLGFEAPSNFLFLLGLFWLLAISLSLSVIVSRQSMQIKKLVQDVALSRADGENAISAASRGHAAAKEEEYEDEEEITADEEEAAAAGKMAAAANHGAAATGCSNGDGQDGAQ